MDSSDIDAVGTPAGPGEGVRLARVVIGVDFHESSWEAALWVLRALAPEADHHLVHSLDLPELPAPLRGLGGRREELRAAARERSRHRLEELCELGGRPDARGHVREGKPAAEILQVAAEVGADLIVVGEQGPRRGVGALLGSTAERVLFDSPVPVLVARKVGDTPPLRLLAAVDASEAAARVLAWTRALLERFGGSATVLNVVDRLLLVDELSGVPSADGLGTLQHEATVSMSDWLDAAVRAAGLPEPRATTRVAVGDPSYEIIAEAAREGADLVVIGSVGDDVARTPLVGRIVNRVVRSAPCSVLVVRGGG